MFIRNSTSLSSILLPFTLIIDDVMAVELCFDKANMQLLLSESRLQANRYSIENPYGREDSKRF